MLLVVIVIFLFLRSFRATVIPAIAIPVSLIGTFSVLYFLGYTINSLTLMGLTLAIGLVVDDAIVVLENISRLIESGMAPMEASRRGMKEISFAVIAATVAVVAVFLPLAFMNDATGLLFREFGVTVATAVAISGFVALTLSPALCARILRPPGEERGIRRMLSRLFDASADAYGGTLRTLLKWIALPILAGVLWVGLGAYLINVVETDFIPVSDRGAIRGFTRAPEG